jgi:hypothetical protein
MKRNPLSLVFIILTVLFFAFPTALQAEDQGSVRIEGVVRDLTSGTPVAPIGSVDIIINGWMVVHSGRDGEWNITGLKPGEYTVELGLPLDSYTPAQDVITVGLWTAGDMERLDLEFYQGAAPPGLFADTDDIAPVVPAVPDQTLGPDSGALVAPPLVATDASSEAAETMAQATGLTPEVEPVADQAQADDMTNQPTMVGSAEDEETDAVGEEIPGLGGAGPAQTPDNSLSALLRIVGGFAILLGLIFVISGIRTEGSRNVD